MLIAMIPGTCHRGKKLKNTTVVLWSTHSFYNHYVCFTIVGFTNYNKSTVKSDAWFSRKILRTSFATIDIHFFAWILRIIVWSNYSFT